MRRLVFWLVIGFGLLGPTYHASGRERVEEGEQVLMMDRQDRTFVGVVTTSGEAALVIEDEQGRTIERPWDEIRSVSRFVVPSSRRERVKRRESGVLGRVPLLWLHGEFGGSSAGFGTNVGVSFKTRTWPTLQVRRLALREGILGHGHPTRVPYIDYDETAILVVPRRTYRYVAIQGGGGLAWIEGTERGRYLRTVYSSFGDPWFYQYERQRIRTVGLAGSLGATWTPSRFWGLGVTVLGDANLERPFWGVFLGLQVGHLTRRH